MYHFSTRPSLKKCWFGIDALRFLDPGGRKGIFFIFQTFTYQNMLKIPFKKSSFFADKTLSVVGISIRQRAIPKNITLF